VETDYPWAGEVKVRVARADGAHRRPVPAGYATVDADWQVGDEVRLELPIGPRWTHPDPRVDAIRGCEGARPLRRRAGRGVDVHPVHTWGNRGLATMRVWVPEA
jgi:DUF1680 family protein